MGGKKPAGDHPSRGSYFRRQYSSRGGHHAGGSGEQHSCQHEPLVFETDSAENEVPDYQEFSLFSALSSVNRFGDFLSTSREVSCDAEKELSTNESGIDTEAFKERNQEAFVRSFRSHDSSYDVLLKRNEQLECSIQRLEETIHGMSQQIERLNYEHGLMVQQLQQSWHFMHSQFYNQESISCRGYMEPKTYFQRKDVDFAGANDAQHVHKDMDIVVEIRKLNERLSTLEGRHKLIQGKVSQLDKIYGPTSTAWGKHIKGILDEASAIDEENVGS